MTGYPEANGDLFAAIEAHDVTAMARLLARGADPNRAHDDSPGWRPLHAAIEELESGASADLLAVLLRHGADADARDTAGDATPLLMACFRRQHEAIRLLLAAGASVDVVGAEGDSPLRWAAGEGDVEIARLLLACGAAALVDDAGGITGANPLGLAAARLNEPLVRLLLEYGANPEAPDADRLLPWQRLPVRSDADPAPWDTIAAALKAPGTGQN